MTICWAVSQWLNWGSTLGSLAPEPMIPITTVYCLFYVDSQQCSSKVKHRDKITDTGIQRYGCRHATKLGVHCAGTPRTQSCMLRDAECLGWGCEERPCTLTHRWTRPTLGLTDSEASPLSPGSPSLSQQTAPLTGSTLGSSRG